MVENKNHPCPNRFFKVLLDGFSEKLKIPPDFFGSLVGQTEWKVARIKSCIGQTWLVEVHKHSDGFHYFSEGWEDFIRAHDICFGYFLVFDHEGDMVFNVSVFDLSGCAKCYNHILGKNNINVISDFQECTPSNISEDEEKRSSMTPCHPEVSTGKCKRPNFHVILKTCHFRKKPFFHVPYRFVASNDISGIPKAILTNAKGNWEVNLSHILRGGKMHAQLRRGWKEFRSENELKEGDVCVFELMYKDKDGIYFHVTKQKEVPKAEHVPVNKINGKKEKTNPIENAREKERREEKTKAPENPSFEIRLQRHNLTKAYVRIPRTFEEYDYILDKHHVILRDVNGKKWEVTVNRSISKGKASPRLGKGWFAFCRNHQLEDGDVCMFSLVSKGAVPLIDIRMLKNKPQNREIKKENDSRIQKNLMNDIVDVENLDCNVQKNLMEDISDVEKLDNRIQKTPTVDVMDINKSNCEVQKNLMDYILAVKELDDRIQKDLMDDSMTQKNLMDELMDVERSDGNIRKNLMDEIVYIRKLDGKPQENFVDMIDVEKLDDKIQKNLMDDIINSEKSGDEIQKNLMDEMIDVEKLDVRIQKKLMDDAVDVKKLEGKIQKNLTNNTISTKSFDIKIQQNLMDDKINVKKLDGKIQNLERLDCKIQKNHMDDAIDVEKVNDAIISKQRLALSRPQTRSQKDKKNIWNSQMATETKDFAKSSSNNKIIITNETQFQVVLRPFHLSKDSYLAIPTKFEGLKHLSGKDKVTFINRKGQSWEVGISLSHYYPKKSYFRFRKGWLQFLLENGSEVGDICMLKLISKENDVVFRVEVQKKNVSCKLELLG